ncbi:MAG: site-specific integrase [Roseburia sp.]|nr:site-specific integrase [Roseburia sp.]
MRRTKGTGSIYKRKDGRWCASIYDDKDGKITRRYVYGRTQKEVHAKLKQLEEQMQTEKEQALHPFLSKKFSDWVYEYLEVYKKPLLKQTTYNTYQNFYRKHILRHEIGKMPVGELSAEYIQEYYRKKQLSGLSAKTIHHIHVLINGSLTKAFQLGYLERNVCERVVLPKKERFTGEHMNLEDAKRFIADGKDERLYPIIVTAMLTGLRRGELFGLHWGDIDWENQILHVNGSLCRVQKTDDKGKSYTDYEVLSPKTTKSRRNVPLSHTVVQALLLQKEWQETSQKLLGESYENPENFVFTEEDGSIIDHRRFLDQYYAVLEKYNISRIRFHDLRHTFASLLLESGENIKSIQELLGHSQISTTMDIYAHFSENLKKKSIQNLSNLIGDD